MTPGDATISSAQFRQILDVSRMLAVTTELDTLLVRIAEAAVALLDCERASIFLHDDKTNELTSAVALQSGEIRVPSSAGIVGHVFKNNQVLHVPTPYSDPRFNAESDRRSGFVTRNLLTAPMVNLDRKPLGVIQAVNNRSAVGFTSMHEAVIQLLADQAGVAIQRYRLQQSAVEATNLRREMELASKVQQAMLPQHAPQIAGLDVVGWTKPASVTGGDVYDLWPTSDGRLGIFVADATGHGLGPALVVSQTRTLVRALSEMGCDAHDLLDHVNARLAQDLHGGSFVTAFVGFVSTGGQINWSAAGHGPMLLRRGASGAFEELEPPAPPLGVVDFFTAERTVPIQLEPGGMLAVVSDGVFDARSPTHETFDSARLQRILSATPAPSMQALLDQARAQIKVWQGTDEPIDDQTIVLVRRG